jgi:hypothetical protein
VTLSNSPNWFLMPAAPHVGDNPVAGDRTVRARRRA